MVEREAVANDSRLGEVAGFRTAALLVGTLATCAVLLTQVAPLLLDEALLLVTNQPATTTVGEVVGELNMLLWLLGTRLVPLLALLIAFYLTSGRNLPAAPVAAGAFVGSLIAPIGFVLGAAYLRPVNATLLDTDALVRFSTVTIGFVVPTLLAALLGGAMDDLWERGARCRGSKTE